MVVSSILFGIFKCEVLMKRLHKIALLGWIAITMLVVSVPAHSFFIFNMADLRHVSSRIVSATRSTMSSIRNFLVPARFTVMAKSHLPNIKHSNVGRQVASFASTAVSKMNDTYENGKKHAKATKEALKLKANETQERIKRISFLDRLRLSNFFGDEVELG